MKKNTMLEAFLLYNGWFFVLLACMRCFLGSSTENHVLWLGSVAVSVLAFGLYGIIKAIKGQQNGEGVPPNENS